MSTPDRKSPDPFVASSTEAVIAAPAPVDSARPQEFGGPCGPEPTRFGDWERNGRCIDF
jgi:hypothetical protein